MALLSIDIEEAQNNIKAIMSEVYHSGEEAVITRKGKPWVVISPADEDDPKYSGTAEYPSACLLE